MNPLSYTGVGSRKTPDYILQKMRSMAYCLARSGYSLRSGAADGADAAFEAGAKEGDGAREIYLPWLGFNGHASGLVRCGLEAEELARSVHPAWERLKPSATKLHIRNVHQVLGLDLKSPSAFVVCWTADGCDGKASRTWETGGTATAILIAERFRIPVINLARTNAEDRIRSIAGDAMAFAKA